MRRSFLISKELCCRRSMESLVIISSLSGLFEDFLRITWSLFVDYLRTIWWQDNTCWQAPHLWESRRGLRTIQKHGSICTYDKHILSFEKWEQLLNEEVDQHFLDVKFCGAQLAWGRAIHIPECSLLTNICPHTGREQYDNHHHQQL